MTDLTLEDKRMIAFLKRPRSIRDVMRHFHLRYQTTWTRLKNLEAFGYVTCSRSLAGGNTYQIIEKEVDK